MNLPLKSWKKAKYKEPISLKIRNMCSAGNKCNFLGHFYFRKKNLLLLASFALFKNGADPQQDLHTCDMVSAQMGICKWLERAI